MDLGTRLRQAREARGLSQRQLAKMAGVTNGTISLIEQNRVSPSVSSLKKVLEGMSLSLADFFEADHPAPQRDEQTFYTGADLVELTKQAGDGRMSYRVVGRNLHGRAMEIAHETYEPGADTGTEPLLEHDGEEGGVVVHGRIELTVDEETRVLGPGDAYYFDSRRPHRFHNPFDAPCEIISSNSPPTF